MLVRVQYHYRGNLQPLDTVGCGQLQGAMPVTVQNAPAIGQLGSELTYTYSSLTSPPIGLARVVVFPSRPGPDPVE